MIDPSLALQGALVAALKAGGGVGVVDRVYDKVPAGPTFPYVTVGDGQVIPDLGDCLEGAEVFTQVDAWSRAEGYPEVKQIAANIAAKLHDANLTVTGFRVVSFLLQDTRFERDPDGQTRHAVMTFHALTEPV